MRSSSIKSLATISVLALTTLSQAQTAPRPVDPPTTRPADPVSNRPMDGGKSNSMSSDPSGMGAAVRNQAAPQEALNDAQILDVIKTANDGEIKAANLAEKVSDAKTVKAFAQQMIKEHGQVNKEVQTTNYKMKFKSQDSTIKTELKNSADQSYTRLKDLKGAEFNRAYADVQVMMHQTVLDTIDTSLLPNVKSAEVKTLLNKVRPAVAMHLDHAKALQSSLGSQM